MNSPETPTTVAVIGAGYFARFQIEAWQRLADAALVGLCDHNGKRLQEAAALAAQAVTFNDAARMLDSVKPNIVDIATPPASHRKLVQLCAERGIDCICQKPLAPNQAEAQAIVELAEQAGIKLAVHENFRFMPWHTEQARLIASGHLGTLHGISMRLRPGDGQGPRAYLDRQPYFQQMERFLVHETAIHFIDTFRMLCGEIGAVYARLQRLNPVIRGEDSGLIVFDFEAGIGGLLDGNRLNDHDSDNTRRTMGEMWIAVSCTRNRSIC